MQLRLLALLLIAIVALALGACGGDDDEAGEGLTATARTAVDTGGDAEATGCRSVEAPEPRPSGTGKAPTALLNEDETYDVVVQTNCGDFTIRLDPKASPKTAASFAALVEAKF